MINEVELVKLLRAHIDRQREARIVFELDGFFELLYWHFQPFCFVPETCMKSVLLHCDSRPIVDRSPIWRHTCLDKGSNRWAAAT
jgi:hypothetical protein